MASRKKQPPTQQQIDTAEAAIAEFSQQIKFTIAELPVSYYVERFVAKRYYVPEYQRSLNWAPARQSKFIESLLIGLPIPFMFFYQTDSGSMEIVDGSQRLRTLKGFLTDGLVLRDLELLTEANGLTFNDLPERRQKRIEDITIRTIVLDTETDPATRAEMFARINTGGTIANEAEVRRGSLPGPMTELIKELAESENFIALTPLSQKFVEAREREELVTRFFTYLESFGNDESPFKGYRDRPKKYLFDFLKAKNAQAEMQVGYLRGLKEEFERMLQFVGCSFPNGFRKTLTARTIPRVRFEAIAVGSALALRKSPNLVVKPIEMEGLMQTADFDRIVTSDGANVRSKLVNRITLVRNVLLGQ